MAAVLREAAATSRTSSHEYVDYPDVTGSEASALVVAAKADEDYDGKIVPRAEAARALAAQYHKKRPAWHRHLAW